MRLKLVRHSDCFCVIALDDPHLSLGRIPFGVIVEWPTSITTNPYWSAEQTAGTTGTAPSLVLRVMNSMTAEIAMTAPTPAAMSMFLLIRGAAVFSGKEAWDWGAAAGARGAVFLCNAAMSV